MGFNIWPFRGKSRSGSSPQLSVAGQTDVGRVRAENEDSYQVLWGEKSRQGIDALLVVADGMDGHAAGEVASRMAVDGVVSLLTGSDAAASTKGHDYLDALGRVLQDVNATVYQAGQDSDKHGMGTTCTVAVIRGDHLYVSHVGDSRAYLLRSGVLHQITEDHSWVEEQVAQGHLSKEEARGHPNRNIITRAIGLEPIVKVDGYLVSLAANDVVLLCSDGLTTMIEDSQIEATLAKSNPKEAGKVLIDEANAVGGQDNITVAVAKVIGGLRESSPVDADTIEINRPASFWRRFSRFVLRRGRKGIKTTLTTVLATSKSGTLLLRRDQGEMAVLLDSRSRRLLRLRWVKVRAFTSLLLIRIPSRLPFRTSSGVTLLRAL